MAVRGGTSFGLAGGIVLALTCACTPDPAEAPEPEHTDAAPLDTEPYVALHLPGSDSAFWDTRQGWPDLPTLQNALEEALVRAKAGAVSGNEVAVDGTEVIIFLFGPDPQRLLEAVDPVLRLRGSPPRGSYAAIRGGQDEPRYQELVIPGPTEPPFPQGWTYGETWFWTSSQVERHGGRWEPGADGERFRLVSGGRCAASVLESGARGRAERRFQTLVELQTLGGAEPFEEPSRTHARSCLSLAAQDEGTYRRMETEVLSPPSGEGEPVVLEREEQLPNVPLCVTSPRVAQKLSVALLHLAEICRREPAFRAP